MNAGHAVQCEIFPEACRSAGSVAESNKTSADEAGPNKVDLGKAGATEEIATGEGCGRKQGMVRKGEHLRLAVALFDDPERLLSTVLKLFDAGVVLDQICIAGLTTTVDRINLALAHANGNGARLAGLVGRLQDWMGPDGDGSITASAGALLDVWRNVVSCNNEATRGKAMISAEHRQELEQSIRNGAIVLIVSSATPAQQTASARTLLSCSSHRVRTYEFNLPAFGA